MNLFGALHGFTTLLNVSFHMWKSQIITLMICAE